MAYHEKSLFGTCKVICQWFSLMTALPENIIGELPHSLPKIVIHRKPYIIQYLKMKSAKCQPFGLNLNMLQLTSLWDQFHVHHLSNPLL